MIENDEQVLSTPSVEGLYTIFYCGTSCAVVLLLNQRHFDSAMSKVIAVITSGRDHWSLLPKTAWLTGSSFISHSTENPVALNESASGYLGLILALTGTQQAITQCSCLPSSQWYCKVYALDVMLEKGIFFETFRGKLLQECKEWWWVLLSSLELLLSSKGALCWCGEVWIEEDGLCCLPTHSCGYFWLQITAGNCL